MRSTIEMAREVESDAGFQWCVNFTELARFEHLARADERKIVMSQPLTKEMWQRFEDEIRADEREACAKLVEPSEEHRRDASWGYIGGEEGVSMLDDLAAEIRARGETK